MVTLHEVAARTPSTRRRHVDLLRALAIAAVVLGHWFVMNVERGADGYLSGFSVLRDLPALHPVTWVFQVMPLFFLVGGVANAISWTRHRDRGGSVAAWLLGRSARLFPPVTALLLVTAAGTLVALWSGAPVPVVAHAVHLVTMPLWFLVAYLAVIALTPLAHRLHERYGLAVPAVLLAVVVVGDVLRLTSGDETWAMGSFVGWLAVHQVGFAWQDGSLRLTARRAAALLGGALVALVLLTGPGPYPVSMVSVPGAALQNPSPPTLALMALATAQIALAVLVAGPAERWLRRRRPWSAVIGANSVVLTVFLWHMPAALLGALALDAFGALPPYDVHSTAWWLGRVPWVLLLTVVLAGLVAVAGQVERRTLLRRLTAPAEQAAPGAGSGARLGERLRPLASLPAVVSAYLAAIGGLLWIGMASQGPHGPLMVPTGALVLVLAGAAALRLARSAGPEPDVENRPAAPSLGCRRRHAPPAHRGWNHGQVPVAQALPRRPAAAPERAGADGAVDARGDLGAHRLHGPHDRRPARARAVRRRPGPVPRG